MNGLERIRQLADAGVLADIDRYFALLMSDLGASEEVALAAAVTSAMHRGGHTCLDLKETRRPIVELVEQPDAAPSDPLPGALAGARLPPAPELRAALRPSPVATEAEIARESPRPLVLDLGKLYLHRLFVAEFLLAERMLGLANNHVSVAGSARVVERVFAPGEDRTEEADAAIRATLERRLCIVTGGPGTGKTTLAAKLIAILVESDGAAPRRIGLAAPTGKASSRLQESVRARLAQPPLARIDRLSDFPAEARTIHQLLADRSRPLQRLDALVIDECSMADLALMARLVEAVPPDCRLILLGDANQLSSVEPGSVFSDLCGAGAGGALAPCVVTLRKNYRFGARSSIGKLAAAVVGADAERALAVLTAPEEEATTLRPLDAETGFDGFARECAAGWARHMRALEENPVSAPPFPARRVLCSHRRGPFGTRRFNRLVERRLTELGRRGERDEFYPGRPIIVFRNDRQTGLSNGDTGVVLPDEGAGRRVWFPDLDREGERFEVTPSRLPEHESFFALTVHRSQGSEYDEVVFIPGDAVSHVNTRESLYTAVTRARNKVTVLGTEGAVKAAVMNRATRATGLLDRLR